MGFAARTIGEIRRGESRYLASAIISGATLGLALDSYTGARLAPIALVASFVLAWTLDRRRAYVVALAALILASVVTVSPLALHFAGHPGDLTTHTWDTSFLNPANPGGGTISAAARGVTATVVSFVWRGDPNAGENLPGRALLDPLGALGLLVGIVATIASLGRQRRRKSGAWLAAGFVAIWFAVMTFPMALALPVPAFVRISGAIVPLTIIVGAGWATLARRVAPSSMTVGIVLLGLGSATWTAYDYFIVWGNTYAYRGAMVDKAEAAAVAVSAPETRVFLAPLWARDFGVEFLARRRPPETFATGAGAIVPTGAGSALYLFPGEDSAAADRIGALLPGPTKPEPILTARDPSAPLLWILRLATIPATPTPRWTLENGIGLLDATLDRSGVAPEATTRWLAVRRPTVEYTIFVQARIGDRVVGQRDGPPLDGSVPTTRWQTGDIAIDRRRIEPRPGESLAGAKVYVGMYESTSGRRSRALDVGGAPSTTDEIVLE
ncbi:MAG: hypothetical protein EPO26_11135 [Chloroflexota bacterium]|nr:MAG: hypothetical protein EPO26_11135 [Chloroflexota bacterium]